MQGKAETKFYDRGIARRQIPAGTIRSSSLFLYISAAALIKY
jgi:hypothetical protein